MGEASITAGGTTSVKAQVISGEVGRIMARQKAGQQIELGELMVAEHPAHPNEKMLLQTFGLQYGSQISQQNLELISGLELEENVPAELIDANVRTYTLALLKNVLTLKNNTPSLTKTLPPFLAKVRTLDAEDVSFLTKPKNALFFGRLRSGSKTVDADIFLPGDKVLSHHVLIAATTGRGKSNLTACMLWDSMDKDYCGILVLDPHDEYYGRTGLGLKDHEKSERVSYYAPYPPPGGRTLKINLETLRPTHFNGVTDWSQPQKEAMDAYFRRYGRQWIEAIILEKPLEEKTKYPMFFEGTIGVIKRRMLGMLNLEFQQNQLFCNGVFDLTAGATTVKDIGDDLERGGKVIIDTSLFSGAVEILIGSIIAHEVLDRYRHYKTKGLLDNKPVISIILEEAPRVLGKEILEKSSNIFSTIAREGRKFNVGLIAITQLPSLIPRSILANMNTKIILGLEMAPERQAIIESAAQDLSEDNRTIASLDKGEAIITSTFARFAIPIKIPLFTEMVKEKKQTQQNVQPSFEGVRFG